MSTQFAKFNENDQIHSVPYCNFSNSSNALAVSLLLLTTARLTMLSRDSCGAASADRTAYSFLDWASNDILINVPYTSSTDI